MRYCAHAIFYFELLEAAQDSFLVHENVYLIEAADSDIAFELAEAVAKSRENRSGDGGLAVNDERAAYVFAGIRKLIEVELHAAPESPSGMHDLELTYSVFEVDTLEEVHALASGEMVAVLYRD